MPGGDETLLRIDAATLSLLACPVCRGALRPEAVQLVCARCGRAFPVRDGIPRLIAKPTP